MLKGVKSDITFLLMGGTFVLQEFLHGVTIGPCLSIGSWCESYSSDEYIIGPKPTDNARCGAVVFAQQLPVGSFDAYSFRRQVRRPHAECFRSLRALLLVVRLPENRNFAVFAG